MHHRQREQESQIQGQVIGEEGIAKNPKNGLDISGMTDAGVDTRCEEDPVLATRKFGNANHYGQREVLPMAEIDCHSQGKGSDRQRHQEIVRSIVGCEDHVSRP